ncbi:helix-turn-helix domain-containing protein [Trueperella pyogenes]|uniref:helix-turn-helix domain-containing protein n=1 Tax=Trueperella pyogenes TaxID=1661 RepID=UPI003C74B8C2
MDDWAQIRILHNEGMSIRQIARRVGCAKKTVERALVCSTPPCYKQHASQKHCITNDVACQLIFRCR